MPNPITLQSSLGLSDILGAYDVGHWETVTAQLKPSTGTLLRGSVLSSVVADAGKLTLTVGGSEATAYGILLDKSVDTTAPFSGGSVTASVARAGSFRGEALIVGAGTDEAALAKQLRLIGIFTEGAIAPVALAAKASEEEKPDHKRDHRHADKA
jgi:Bacteriophage lambda head decoration protein D